MSRTTQGMKWTKCPECGLDLSGYGTEAAQKLFSHRLLHHKLFTDFPTAIRSMTDTMQDQSTLPEAEKNQELAVLSGKHHER